MLAIPRAALALGLAGLIPFIYGALVTAWPNLILLGVSGRDVLELYGVIIFAYMAGVFWGFAAAGGRTGWVWMLLAVAPAVVAFLALIADADAALAVLLVGFPSLLVLDFAFWRARLAPPWWLGLRGLLTSIVTLCLYIGAAA
ncbi:MAG: DUF3429 domain-containing protein [Pseudomonadota bacterium]